MLSAECWVQDRVLDARKLDAKLRLAANLRQAANSGLALYRRPEEQPGLRASCVHWCTKLCQKQGLNN